MLVRDYIELMQTWPQDEPIFVLRAQDRLAPFVVRLWAEHALRAEVNSAKVREARKCANDMGCWPNKKLPD